MPGLRARVHKRRLVLDEPTDLPEGTVLRLAIVDDERPGKVHPAADVLSELRRAANRGTALGANPQRDPSPAKWTYMQEVGRTRYVVTRTLSFVALYLMSCIVGGFLAGATVQTFSWVGVAASVTLMALLVFFKLVHYWNQAEASEVLNRPTAFA